MSLFSPCGPTWQQIKQSGVCSPSSFLRLRSFASSNSAEPRASGPQGCGQILSGEVVTDRRSRFQAHIARVNSVDHVESIVTQIRARKDMKKATHQMVAYRLSNGVSARDDGGEGGAGDRILSLLERMNQTDIVAIVTRWYGGVPLGGDRFRIITSVVKKLIESKKIE
ncbi:ribosomal protein S5 domain 2-type protein [Chytriomyces sp. MP71]|nr:ribosomal protein S5 domain 2-type protein [Chytriomyces sp. MP71]